MLRRILSEETNVLILGPSNAGKTCLLFKLVNNKFPLTVASQTNNTVQITLDKKVINLHDLTDSTQVLGSKFKRCKYIMILDSTCRKSIKQLSLLLYNLITHATVKLSVVNVAESVSVLVLCNKSDVYNSKNVNEVEKLMLLELELISTTTDDSGQLAKVFSNLNSLKELKNIGVVLHLMPYSIKNNNLQEIKQYIIN
ncbi:ADP-ribosylation factor family protein [Theileria parva strain Muguga]|uniref:Signal recognition particle receptor subunit beta n=1 Tax=Theileria parva TaxID=5875 RepID=Q4N3V9_THEPA|nr:ADP-ribosylation factor family protein [Theileria parva strain Muguga]EAN33164.1 ADP-ribosylation factor family protein [Theileria parva strain Muguga]|eukprot:XP_765447.1 hypothetical protein [Theileria parva strain Muguga]